MKTDIHPKYAVTTVKCSCGNTFETRSTATELRAELCSECHPFYTGKQKLVDTGGRVERFQRRYAKAQTAKKSARTVSNSPRFLGGQAVMEGVMIRGFQTWAVAVRTPEGEIEVVVKDAPTWAERWSKVPLLRGVTSLVESTALGFKALSWSADRQIPEDERISSKAMNITMGIAVLMFTGIFILVPAFANRALTDALGVKGFAYHLVEGAIRLSIFLGYLFLIGRLRDIKRVFQYHGAEHKAIAAFENEAPLEPEAAQRFTTQHVRCGTNFLLTVMVMTILVYSFTGRPPLFWLIVSRITLIPLIAGLSYEVIRFAARHMDRRWVRVIMKPGLTLQKLTTREPDLDQLEVALASLRAVLTAEQVAEVEARVATTPFLPAAQPAI